MSKTLLHVHSDYSIGDSIARPDKICEVAKARGYKAVSISDHGVIGGIPSFLQAAKKHGLKPILGVETYFNPDLEKSREAGDRTNNHLCVYAKNRDGYFSIVGLSSEAWVKGMYFKPRCDLAMLEKYSKGVVVTTACLGGVLGPLLRNDDYKGARTMLGRLFDIYGPENVFVEIQFLESDFNKDYVQRVLKLKELYPNDVRLIFGHDVHYLREEDWESHELFLNIYDKRSVGDEHWRKTHSRCNYIRSTDAIKLAYKTLKYDTFMHNSLLAEALANCDVLADMVEEFDINQAPVMPNLSNLKHYTKKSLEQLCVEGFKARGLDKLPPAKRDVYKNQLKHELSVINKLGFADYFLVMRSIIDVATDLEVPVGPGRGSSAGALVNYLVGNTNVDPIAADLMFERFLVESRKELPDIDTDFGDINKVINEIVNRFGDYNVVRIATYSTYQYKGLVHDLSRIFNLPSDEVMAISNTIHIPPNTELSVEEIIAMSPEFGRWLEKYKKLGLRTHIENLLNVIRHKGQHAAGILITPDDCWKYFPVEKLGGTIVSAYTEGGRARELLEAGGVKFDILGLNTLRIQQDAIQMIAAKLGISVKEMREKLDFSRIPMDDKTVFDSIFKKADTYDIFQFESPTGRRLCASIKPDSVDDLCAINAINRPGPLQAGYGEKYAKIKFGKISRPNIHPLVNNILADSYGTMLYQEHIIKIAKQLGDLSDGEADKFRKLVFKLDKQKGEELQDKRMAEIEKINIKWNKGALEKGMTQEAIEALMKDMKGFESYAFNKSHSYSYAVVAYVSAYIKAHWPDEWHCAYLSNIAGDPDKVKFYLKYLRMKGYTIVPPGFTTVDKPYSTVVGTKTIALGADMLKGVNGAAVNVVVKHRDKIKNFNDAFVFACIDENAIDKRSMEAFIKIGFFDELTIDGSNKLERAKLLLYYNEMHKKLRTKIKSFAQKNDASHSDILAKFGLNMKEMYAAVLVQAAEELNIYQAEVEVMAFSLNDHPVMEFKTYADNQKVNPANVDKIVCLGEIVAIKRKVSPKNKKTYGIVTIECIYDATHGTQGRSFRVTFWQEQLDKFKPEEGKYGMFIISHPHPTFNTSNLTTFIDLVRK